MTLESIITFALLIGLAVACGVLYYKVATLLRDLDAYKLNVAESLTSLQRQIKILKCAAPPVPLGDISAVYDQDTKTLTFDGNLVTTGAIVAGSTAARED